MISQQTLARSAELQQAFVQAKPFRHVVIEDFFTDDVMAALHAQFPSFQDKNALNEFGQVGGKAVVTELKQLGPAYREINAYLNSPDFLNAMSAITGIPDLLPDPAMYGGGTHENVERQELDVHVDYNYINNGKLHRRLNLLVYFNKEWQKEWGGNIELHSNPRSPDDDEVSSYEPLYNRALIFETNEYSWHGFEKIVLPPGQKHITRRSLAIYLYTSTRPEDEIAPAHGTFYVQRPLPDCFKPGHVLTEESRREIQILLTRRDHWITAYQKNELAMSATIAQLQASGSVRQLPRMLYRSLPVSDEAKRKMKKALFTRFGFLFKNRRVYKNWQAQQK